MRQVTETEIIGGLCVGASVCQAQNHSAQSFLLQHNDVDTISSIRALFP